MALVGLGVTGGIGAYKAVELARLLQKRGHEVQAVMTRAARRFVGPLTFEAITRKPVVTSQFAPGLNADIEHIALASAIDLLLVAPATANIIGKFANGISRAGGSDEAVSPSPMRLPKPPMPCSAATPHSPAAASSSLPDRRSRIWIPCGSSAIDRAGAWDLRWPRKRTPAARMS